jgi:hypothetical protein
MTSPSVRRALLAAFIAAASASGRRLGRGTPALVYGDCSGLGCAPGLRYHQAMPSKNALTTR